MIHVAESLAEPVRNRLLQSMFRARKEVFVDLLRWNVPVLEGDYEVDQFDTPAARYLVIADEDGHHHGSARVLATTGPHILAQLFTELCAGPVPSGPDVAEITRFCLDRHLRARERLSTRNRLVSALVRDALERGVRLYTGVAELGWLQQILAFGWHCRPLGLPRSCAGGMIGALAIEIDRSTPYLLAANGIWTDEPLPSSLFEAA